VHIARSRHHDIPRISFREHFILRLKYHAVARAQAP
jgi:hypothetical protein